jgi:hypothetical protein
MNGGQDHPLALTEGGLEFIPSGDPGVFDQLGQALSMEDEYQPEGPGKLEVGSAQQPQFRGMIQFGEDDGQIFVSNLDAKRKNHPGKIADSGGEKENYSNRQKIDDENGASK